MSAPHPTPTVADVPPHLKSSPVLPVSSVTQEDSLNYQQRLSGNAEASLILRQQQQEQQRLLSRRDGFSDERDQHVSLQPPHYDRTKGGLFSQTQAIGNWPNHMRMSLCDMEHANNTAHDYNREPHTSSSVPFDRRSNSGSTDTGSLYRTRCSSSSQTCGSSDLSKDGETVSNSMQPGQIANTQQYGTRDFSRRRSDSGRSDSGRRPDSGRSMGEMRCHAPTHQHHYAVTSFSHTLLSIACQ